MAKTILTKRQSYLLKLLFEQVDIRSKFYLTGGTALAEYYLYHRLSEDLDFFSNDEINPLAVQIFFKKIKKQIQIKKIDYQQSFNRNLYFLHFADEIIKTEFTYFPFASIGNKVERNDVIVDSLIDIAVNKAFTIYQNPRSRDFIDLYLILKMKNLNFSDLLKKARIKFDTHIDPLQLGQQLLLVKELKDYPRMIIPIEENICQEYWISEVKKLKVEAIK